jgi:hypothetical protein
MPMLRGTDRNDWAKANDAVRLTHPTAVARPRWTHGFGGLHSAIHCNAIVLSMSRTLFRPKPHAFLNSSEAPYAPTSGPGALRYFEVIACADQ